MEVIIFPISIAIQSDKVMDIQHIAIPLDQLQIFKDQDNHQHFLVETLLYSTKATLHSNQNKTKCSLIITKHNIWLEQDNNRKRKRQLPLKTVTALIKAEHQPEMVLVTEQTEDNLRISLAQEQRTSNIISALSFYFTHLATPKRSIKLYLIKQNSLLYFERTVKQKKNGPKLNLDRYTSLQVDYVEPNDSPDIFGKMVIHKMILAKQLYVHGSYMVHLANINDKQYYLCHTLQKEQQLIQQISKHKNIEFVQKIEYSKKLQYKIQIFFEYLPSLKPRTLKMTELFQQLYRLYDKVKQEKKDGFLTPQMLLRSSQDSKRLILREFRYSFLLFDWEYNAFIYQKIYKQQNFEDYMINKMFNIGTIIYHYLFGRNPFEHEDLQFTDYLKNNMTELPFPKSMPLNYSKKTQIFIQNCILGKYRNVQELRRDPWITLNKINI